MVKAKTRQPEEALDLARVRKDVTEWYALKRQTAMISKRLDEGKEWLKKIVHKYGQVAPDGNIFLDLDGLVGDGKIMTLKNQRAASRTLNAEVAEEIIREKGLWEELSEVVEIIDQDKLAAAYFNKDFTEAEWDQMFHTRVSYSFVLLGDDGKPVS